MFTNELATADPAVTLVQPNVERDAPLSLEWLAGDAGHETLRLMGVSSAENHSSTLEAERQRMQEFLEGADELNWMIQLNGRIVGAIWVHLKPAEGILAPAISLMIGDPAARGHGAGRSALAAVVSWLQHERGAPTMYARHLVENTASAGLLNHAGFGNLGEPYSDKDGLHWQNVQLAKIASSRE